MNENEASSKPMDILMLGESKVGKTTLIKT